MTQTLRDKSLAMVYTMRVLLHETQYPHGLPSVHANNYLLDAVAWRNEHFRDARNRIEEFHKRIQQGGELTEAEYWYFKHFCYQCGYLVRQGTLDDYETYENGVYVRRLMSQMDGIE